MRGACIIGCRLMRRLLCLLLLLLLLLLITLVIVFVLFLMPMWSLRHPRTVKGG